MMKHDTKYKIQDTKYNVRVRALTGGYAVAEAWKQIHPDVVAVYPITPQTTIIETYAKMKADGQVSTEIIQVESEHSAMSATIGASAAGARAVTASSSQGILYMAETLPVVSGLGLPIVMSVSSRALSAPLNIHGEHGDVMAVRDLGWIQIFAEQVQDAYDDTLIAMKLAEEIDAPVMPIMDGFHTSHTTERVEILDDDEAKKFIGERKARQSLVDFENPTTFGTLALQNTFFEFKIDQEKTMQKAKEAYQKICEEFYELSGRKYSMFESYRLEDAKSAIVIMGATTGTAKEVVDVLRDQGKKVGLLSVKLFRPFPYDEIGQVLSHVPKIAVLDRAISFGAYPPLYQDIVSSLHHASSRKQDVVSFVYGLGGRDTMQKDIEKVFEDLEKGEIDNEVRYLL